MKCVEVYKELYHQEPFDVAFCPYRISPLGAHIDHQYGKINGLAIDKGIHMAYHPKQNGVVELQSLNFPKRAQFFVNLYRTSYRLNGECKQAIHEAIADNYDGMYLGDGAVDQVVRQYGMERVGYILANTLHHKNYDGRFSHSNKEWAEQVGTPENNARIIKFRADWVVTSHSAVLDGFVTMYREKLEKQKELEQPFVKRFYVVENRQAVPLEIKRFGNLNDAMSQYQALPNHYMKALGVEKNPDPLPGSLDILQCRNGLDTMD